MKPHPPLARFDRSPFTQALLERLLAAHADAPVVVSYSELSRIAGEDVQSSTGRHMLYSARQILLRDHRIATDAVVNVGVKVLADDGAVAVATSAIRRVRGVARRGLRTLAAVRDPGELPEPARQQHLVTRLVLSVVRRTTDRTVQRRIASSGAAPQEVRKRLLRAFGRAAAEDET